MFLLFYVIVLKVGGDHESDLCIMSIIDTLAVQLFGVTSLIVLLLIILTAFVGISDNNRSQTPSYSAEHDTVTFYTRKHSKLFKSLVGIIALIVSLFQFPLFVAIIYHFKANIFFAVLVFIAAVIIFRLLLLLGDDPNVLSLKISKKGISLYRNNLVNPISSYPVNCYKGIENDMSKLVFEDRVNGIKYLDLKCFSKKDRTMIISEWNYLIKYGHFYRSSSNIDRIREFTNDILCEDPIPVDSDISMSDDIIKDDNIEPSGSAALPFVPFQKINKDTEETSTEETVIEDNLHGEISDIISEEYEDITHNVCDEEAPRAASSCRIYIKNTYLTDIERKISSCSKKDLVTAIDHFPGSSWMYVDLRAEAGLSSVINLFKHLCDLRRDIFLYSSEDDLAAYLNGRKEIVCIKNKKGYIFDNDTSEMIPDPTSDISEDPKTFIRDKFYIDI